VDQSARHNDRTRSIYQIIPRGSQGNMRALPDEGVRMTDKERAAKAAELVAEAMDLIRDVDALTSCRRFALDDAHARLCAFSEDHDDE
jgi:hypothetical protein